MTKQMKSLTDEKEAALVPGLRKEPAHITAHATGIWAEIIFLALSAKVADRWKFISFRGKRKGESRGIVDVLAVRKDMFEPGSEILKRGDLFDIIIVQIKGGSAPNPTPDDCKRLREVARRYRARVIVMFQWKKGSHSEFLTMQRNGDWRAATGKEIFG